MSVIEATLVELSPSMMRSHIACLQLHIEYGRVIPFG